MTTEGEKAYLYWDDFRYRINNHPEISAKIQWMFIKLSRCSRLSEIIVSCFPGFGL